FAGSDPYRVAIAISGTGAAVTPSADSTLADPPPSILGVIQQADADIACPPAHLQGGRIIAVLFSKEVTPESVQDRFKTENITNYDVEANHVVSVALQPGGRIVFLALR